ncbi:MAG: glycosyltransferase, partial [Desulfobulbaceae bacterium]|nr:glycosyltransferase [Desulfobulbaceae bacterium]
MTINDTVTVITVTYNSKPFLRDYFDSILAADRSGLELEIIVVDNGSSDDSPAWIRAHYPAIRVLGNDSNNYTRALNLAIREALSDFILISNNDAQVKAGWIKGLVDIAKSDARIGAVQSKILFSDGLKINSVGVAEIEQFYFKDIGFEEVDNGQYDRPRQVDFITGGSMLLKRECLDDVGLWDEEFIMFMEDVDYSLRCRAKGWQLWCAPTSVMHHRYHGSSSQELCEYLCTRNRFLFIAKHYPQRLADSIISSHFYKKGHMDLLYRSLLHAMQRLCVCQPTAVVLAVLEALKKSLVEVMGAVSAHNFFSHLELLLGLRKIRVGIYDHACHFAGGGQRYVAEMAAIMQDRYDVTYIANKDMDLASYMEWFGLDLSRCALKVIKIPFFEKRERFVPDEGMVLGESYNVFDLIAEDSLSYDIFINANMLGKVNPLSLTSLFVCHFPDQPKAPFFQVDKYDQLITNGDYTGYWLEKRWGMIATHKLYPPVNMYNPASSPVKKEKIILSVSRFEVSGSKKQYELVKAYAEMYRKNLEAMDGWKFVLIGGSFPDNHYLELIRDAVDKAECPIEVR